MEDNYSWLSDSVRNCVCSEPQLWPWICFSTDYSFCQAHTSPSAWHDTATHWHRNSTVFAGSDHRSVSGLFPVLIYTFGKWGNQTCTVFKTQGRYRRTKDTQIQRSSKTPDGLLYSFVCGLTFDSLFCSEHSAHVFMELITHSSFLFLIFCHSSSPTSSSATQQLALPHPQGDGEENQKKKFKTMGWNKNSVINEAK